MRAARGAPAVEQEGVLCYDDAPFGLAAYACFYFGADGLRQGRYVFLEAHADPERYVADFDAVADALAAAFGPPLSDQEAWTAEPGAPPPRAAPSARRCGNGPGGRCGCSSGAATAPAPTCWRSSPTPRARSGPVTPRRR